MRWEEGDGASGLHCDSVANLDTVTHVSVVEDHLRVGVSPLALPAAAARARETAQAARRCSTAGLAVAACVAWMASDSVLSWVGWHIRAGRLMSRQDMFKHCQHDGKSRLVNLPTSGGWGDAR